MSYASVLDRLTEGRALPEGCDTWAMKSVHAGFQTHGFTWPPPGHWAECDRTLIVDNNKSAYPAHAGDGLCVATTFYGMTSGGIAFQGTDARTITLVAYHSEDLLGSDGAVESMKEEGRSRVARAYVVALLDSETVVREYGAGADLSGGGSF